MMPSNGLLVAILFGSVLAISYGAAGASAHIGLGLDATFSASYAVPQPVTSFVAQHLGSYGCVSGTLYPFSITSTVCPSGTNSTMNDRQASLQP